MSGYSDILNTYTSIKYKIGEYDKYTNELIEDKAIIYYKNSLRHRDNDEPAYVSKHVKIWYKDGKKHREDDKPAYISNKMLIWYIDDQKHRGYGNDGKLKCAHLVLPKFNPSSTYRSWYSDCYYYTNGIEHKGGKNYCGEEVCVGCSKCIRCHCGQFHEQYQMYSKVI